MKVAAEAQENKIKNLLHNKNKDRPKMQICIKRKASECTEAPTSPLRKTKTVRKEKSWFFSHVNHSQHLFQLRKAIIKPFVASRPSLEFLKHLSATLSSAESSLLDFFINIFCKIFWSGWQQTSILFEGRRMRTIANNYSVKKMINAIIRSKGTR